MGIQRTNAMGFLRGVIAVLLLASAVAVDRGEVVRLGENDPDPEHINWNVPDGDIIYRISWTNANQGEEMSTVGNVKIEITGAGGETTGELFVVTHPGLVQAARRTQIARPTCAISTTRTNVKPSASLTVLQRSRLLIRTAQRTPSLRSPAAMRPPARKRWMLSSSLLKLCSEGQ